MVYSQKRLELKYLSNGEYLKELRNSKKIDLERTLRYLILSLRHLSCDSVFISKERVVFRLST